MTTKTTNEEDSFEIVHINDFASEEIKAESAKIDASKKRDDDCTKEIESVPICPSLHGGPLDYPKVAPNHFFDVIHGRSRWGLEYDNIISNLKVGPKSLGGPPLHPPPHPILGQVCLLIAVAKMSYLLRCRRWQLQMSPQNGIFASNASRS